MVRALARWIVISLALGTIVLALSGGWRDPWMWTYVGAVSACTLYAVLSVTPDLAQERFHPPAALRVVALPLMMAALLLVFRAMRENRFFSAVVRIQDDRGHRVIDTGPYSLVRHPGYAGMIVGITASGLALGSWIGFAFAAGYAALIARRVSFEDRFLHRRLTGYADYARRVPHRIIPGLW